MVLLSVGAAKRRETVHNHRQWMSKILHHFSKVYPLYKPYT